MIALLRRVRDKLSGFEGYATARCVYATGCVHIEITNEEFDKDQKKRCAAWFDEVYVEYIGSGSLALNLPDSGPGGPVDTPPPGMQHP